MAGANASVLIAFIHLNGASRLYGQAPGKLLGSSKGRCKRSMQPNNECIVTRSAVRTVIITADHTPLGELAQLSKGQLQQPSWPAECCVLFCSPKLEFATTWVCL
jgi:hypothetical protein